MYIDTVLTNWKVHEDGYILGEIVCDFKHRFPQGVAIRTGRIDNKALLVAKKGDIVYSGKTIYLLIEEKYA